MKHRLDGTAASSGKRWFWADMRETRLGMQTRDYV